MKPAEGKRRAGCRGGLETDLEHAVEGGHAVAEVEFGGAVGAEGVDCAGDVVARVVRVVAEVDGFPEWWSWSEVR